MQVREVGQAGTRLAGFCCILTKNKIGVEVLMSKLTTEKYLVRALLDDGAMSKSLFEDELKDQIDEFLKSKQEDEDEFFFAITERDNQVAMLLIDGDDKVHVNEEARAVLKSFWQKTVYDDNILMLLPQMVEELNEGYYFVTGVKSQGGLD
jgi:hypothetical protein